MPSVEQNLQSWNKQYPWPQAGEEWSKVWGGSEAQWFFVIYPRIHRFLPAKTLLEIAPGYGRWTQYLLDYCERLVGVDLSSTCVDACRRRFAAVRTSAFHVNNGYSLEMVADGSIDFTFTFDSLVHAESDVVAAYLTELARKLKPTGVAFLHHSNLGAFRDPHTGELPPTLQNRHWRATSVSASWLARECTRVGLRCASQEIVNWGIEQLTDCFSVVMRAEGSVRGDHLVIENPNFMKEAHHVAKVSRLYQRGPGAQ
jgi:SAM-dependent methyltransferase